MRLDFAGQRALTKWLDKHGVSYTVESNKDPLPSRYYVTCNFADGSYIRISEAHLDLYFYVRDTGLCEYITVYDLMDRILKRKEKEDENRKTLE